QAHDTLGASIMAVVSTAMAFTAFTYVKRRTPAEARTYILLHTTALGVISLAMINWRFYGWVSVMNGLPVEQVRARIPQWWMNAFMVLIYGIIFMTVIATLRRRDTHKPR